MQMHNRLGSWVTVACHTHLGGALKIIEYEICTHHQGKVNDHTWEINNSIIQAQALKYDMIKHMTVQVSHTHIKYQTSKHTNKYQTVMPG